MGNETQIRWNEVVSLTLTLAPLMFAVAYIIAR